MGEGCIQNFSITFLNLFFKTLKNGPRGVSDEFLNRKKSPSGNDRLTINLNSFGILQAGHHVQEDSGEELAKIIAGVIGKGKQICVPLSSFLFITGEYGSIPDIAGEGIRYKKNQQLVSCMICIFFFFFTLMYIVVQLDLLQIYGKPANQPLRVHVASVILLMMKKKILGLLFTITMEQMMDEILLSH